MSLLGIPDPMIWLSYVGSVLCVAFCVIYGHIKNKELSEDGD